MTTRTSQRANRGAPLAAAGLAAGLLLAACSRPPPAPVRLQWQTMGTLAAVQCADHAAAPQARDLAQAEFERLNRELSAWTSDSALAAVNRAAGAPEPVAIPPDFAAVLRFALDVCAASDGAFNPLIGPVMQLWGFNGAAARPAPPPAEELRAAAALADWRGVAFEPRAGGAAVRLPMPGMRLDLGAVAKGYAVDLAWRRLCAAGHTNLLVDLGGNLRALGEAAPGRGGWRTGVRSPFGDGLLAQFLMRSGEAVATSGNYERFVEIEGVRYAHIMDARTGAPVRGMAGTTVVAPDAITADALSTALFVLGPGPGAALLRRYPGCEALWIPDTPERVTVVATPGLAARLKPLGDPREPPPYALTVLRP